MSKVTKTTEELIRTLRDMFKAPVVIEPGTVVSVNEDDLTCVVNPTDGPQIFDVRLKAAIDGVKDGVVQIPTLNSTVLIAMIGNEANTRFIIAFGSVSKIVINGGSKGGLINIQTLIEQLNKTNEVVNAIKNSLTGWTPMPNDGGAALKTYATSQIGSKATGDFSNMEDNKVLH